MAGPGTGATWRVPIGRVEVIPGVHGIGCPFGGDGVVYVYFIEGPGPVLIDTGVAGSPEEAIRPAVAEAGADLSAVRYILNSHGHWDHMGGNAAVRRLAPAARTHIHEADKSFLDGYELHVEGYSPGQRELETSQAREERARSMPAAIGAPTPVDHLLRDGETLHLGGVELVAVHTPGHSPGATCFYWPRERALFTGDAVQGRGSRVGALPLIFYDSRAYRASLSKVAALDVEVLCLGHAFTSSSPDRSPVRFGDDARRFLQQSGEVAKATEEAMRAVLTRLPAAGFREVARETLAALCDQLQLVLDPATGLNERALPTLHSFWRELRGS